MERRLAAILVADVVGYSRLMEADEAGTLAALKQRRTSVLEPTVRAHGGRIVKLMGDGVLVEFASAFNAVTGALELQRRMAEANADVPGGRDIVLRIGINLGDVIGEDQDIYGEGVNIAARLEPLAEPGGICVSAKVHDEVRGRLEAGFEDLGDQTVKNISRPVHAYRVRPGRADAASATPQHSDLSLPDKPSIAVLPFQNMSADPEQDYFADGVVEDIITGLSRIRWLFVIARNSSFTYKGKAVDIKQVGRELGVRYVLEGSVRKAGGRVRITGQLIDASTGAHLWADRFDGDLADIFELQDQVTQRVIGAIAPMMELAEIERAKRKPTESLDAYDHYLRGMAAFHQFTWPANQEALAHFTSAFERDPGYGAAYGMAARCYAQRTGFGWITDRKVEGAEARRLARLAADRGRDDAVALAAAGFTLTMFGEVSDGMGFVERALSLDPNMAWAWHISGMARALLGEPEAITGHAAHAMRLSPQDPQRFAMQAIMGLGEFFAGRYAEAYACGETALREKSTFLLAAGVAAASAAQLGRQDDARRAVARMLELEPRLRVSNLGEWTAFQRPEELDHWADSLRKAGLPE